MSNTIKRINASEILDSRGNPTLEVSVMLNNGIAAVASVPSGASTGTFEAFELRDHDEHRYGGKGVLKACQNVKGEINAALTGKSITEQADIDQTMIKLDGTPNKARLGANAILGVSLACARAAAESEHVPLYAYIGQLYGNNHFQLPIPLINVINGGLHASTNLNIQEFWVIPMQESSFQERLRCGSEVFQQLGTILRKDGRDTDLGNEGGYAPNLDSHKQAFSYLLQAIDKAGYQAGTNCYLGFDAGASVLYDATSKIYQLKLENSHYTSTEFQTYIMQLWRDFPIRACEDPLAEEDWDGWQQLMTTLKRDFPAGTLIGDDLFVTNAERLQKGITLQAANSILIKPNQIGSLTETLQTIQLAKKSGFTTAVSHRSGETIDSFIADLAVAVASDYIKTGSVARGERSAKYNRLLAIEHELNGN
jgi:enolase